MVQDGGPAPGDGYPDPGKYTPDDLGVKKIFQSNDGRLHVSLPIAAIRYLDLEEGDRVKFIESGMDEKTITVRETEEEERQ